MTETSAIQAAKRLIKVLGAGAGGQATQNVLDMRAVGNEASAQFWLDVLDVVTAAQTGTNASNMRSAPFQVREAVTLEERARKLGLDKP